MKIYNKPQLELLLLAAKEDILVASGNAMEDEFDNLFVK